MKYNIKNQHAVKLVNKAKKQARKQQRKNKNYMFNVMLGDA
tara:strand:- start:839 stop:961 length:123 start_codon:yes stop_codon:yes gene_type:complete